MNHAAQDIGLELIRQLYHVPISIIDTSASLCSFEKKYHVHNVQTAITARNIKKIISENPNEMIYLTDSFSLNYIIVPFHTPFIFGPFCTLMLSSNDVRTIFNRYKIEDLSIKDFFSYYYSFPTLTEAQSLHIIETMQAVIFGDSVKKPKKMTITPPSLLNDDSYNIKRENSLELLEKRYYYEQHFLLNIENGNTRSALMDLHNMQADVKYLKRLGTTLESEKIGAAITRTTVRLAAMHANLPIFLIDQLSRKNTLAIIHAKTVDEILHAKEQMIRDFCTAIQDHKSNQYSALVQSILYYFNHNYYQDITMDELANELHVSKNHIINEFKKGTKDTPMSYLRKIRLRQASVLLSGTTLTVQEISDSVGIPDCNYFIKLFKKEYGSTPLLYRKRFG